MYLHKDGDRLMRKKMWLEAAHKYAEAIVAYQTEEVPSELMLISAESSRLTAIANETHGTDNPTPDASLKRAFEVAKRRRSSSP